MFYCAFSQQPGSEGNLVAFFSSVAISFQCQPLITGSQDRLVWRRGRHRIDNSENQVIYGLGFFLPQG